MNFPKTESFIKNKIEELKLPYFKIIVKKDNEEVFNFRHSTYGDDNDLLTMYSMTKVVTSIAFMKLYEKGLVDPEDLVSKYLRGYENLHLISGEKVKNPMKIKHILTMTAGLDYNFERPAILKKISENKDVSTVELSEVFTEDGLLFEPGSKFNYSLCLDVVGAIVEKVSGMPFYKFVEEEIFKPLGMNYSTLQNRPDWVERTIPDVKEKDGNLLITDKFERLLNLSKNYSSGGSSLISTVDDMSKFTSEVINNQIISKKSLDIMTTPYLKETPFCLDVQKYSVASFDYGYGFGVRVRQVASPFGMPIGEFGWDGAAGSYCLMDPVNKITIVMGMNVQDWPNYIKDLHIKVVEFIYSEFLASNR